MESSTVRKSEVFYSGSTFKQLKTDIFKKSDVSKQVLARFFIILIIVCMILTAMPFAPFIDGASSYVLAASSDVGRLDPDDQEGKTFLITGKITDWNVLNDLSKKVEDIFFLNEGCGGGIYTGDLEALLTLGGNGSTIPAINANDAEFIKPFNVLPSYDSINNKFATVAEVKSSNCHQLPYTFYWSGTLKYVYGNSQSTPNEGNANSQSSSNEENGSTKPTVKIIHNVKSKSGTATVSLLEYVGKPDSKIRLDGGLVVDEDCTSGNVVEYECLNDSNSGSVNYIDAVSYMFEGSLLCPDLSYEYDINVEHLSTVAAPGCADILGSITAKVTQDGKAKCHDEIGWYVDAGCKTEAERFDESDGKWVKVSAVRTDENGCCTVSNLRPGTYYVKEMTGGEVKRVVLAESRKSVKLSGGLGSEATVNADSVTLTPDMGGNGNINVTGEALGYTDIDSEANTKTVRAADYGGELFIEAGILDSHISGTADGLVELSECSVTVGSVEERCSSLAGAVDYVNGTLIDAQKLDSVGARDHVRLSQLYADEEMTENVEFRLTSKGERKVGPDAGSGNEGIGSVGATNAGIGDVETSDVARIGMWIAIMLVVIGATIAVMKFIYRRLYRSTK